MKGHALIQSGKWEGHDFFRKKFLKYPGPPPPPPPPIKNVPSLRSISATCITRQLMCTRLNQKDFKVYQSLQELLLKAVAGEDHDEDLAKVMAAYRDTDLQ